MTFTEARERVSSVAAMRSNAGFNSGALAALFIARAYKGAPSWYCILITFQYAHKERYALTHIA